MPTFVHDVLALIAALTVNHAARADRRRWHLDAPRAVHKSELYKRFSKLCVMATFPAYTLGS